MNLKKIFYTFVPTVILIVYLFYLVHKLRKYKSMENILKSFNRNVDCGNLSLIRMEDLKNYADKNTFPNGVPRIVHYNYKSWIMPAQYVPLVENCVKMNQDVKFVLWTDQTSYYLINNHFPTYLNVYKSYNHKNSDPLKKSDLIRYFILEYFGGIYMDLDTRCQRPLIEAMRNDSCILSKEAEVQTRILWNRDYFAMNSFMACVAKHRFFRFLIDNIKGDIGIGPITLTGPVFLTDFYEKYKTLHVPDRINRTSYVSLSSSDLFSPTIKSDLEAYCYIPMRNWAKIGCKDIKAERAAEKEKISKAVVVHLFTHLGYADHRHHIIEKINICDIVDIVQ